jgi:hypothetical protein
LGEAVAVRGLRAGYDDRIVLAGIDLDVAERGALLVLGGPEAGKSTLLAVLGGAMHGWAEWKDAAIGGSRIGPGNWLDSMGSTALKLPPQERAEAVDAFLRRPGIVLGLDDPFAGLSGAYQQAIVAKIAEAAKTRAVLVTSSVLPKTPPPGGGWKAALIEKGMIAQSTPMAEFYMRPATEAGRAIVAAAATEQDEASYKLASDFRPFPKEIPMTRRRSPDGPISWLIPGKLGLADRWERLPDHKTLAASGATMLIDLTAKQNREAISRGDVLEFLWNPTGPELAERLEKVCATCVELSAKGEVLALRCRPGETVAPALAAAILVSMWVPAPDALAAVAYRLRSMPMTLQDEALVADFERWHVRRQAKQPASAPPQGTWKTL